MQEATLASGDDPEWTGRSRLISQACALSQRTFSILWQASTPTGSVPQAKVVATIPAASNVTAVASSRMLAIYYLRDLSGKYPGATNVGGGNLPGFHKCRLD